MKVHIDFQEAKQTLNESWMQMFASWTKDIMRHVYGKDVPVIATINEDDQEEIELKIVGQYQDVKAYAKAIKAEVDYIDALEKRRDKAHPEVVRKKETLDAKTSHFQNLTGIDWPIK